MHAIDYLSKCDSNMFVFAREISRLGRIVIYWREDLQVTLNVDTKDDLPSPPQKKILIAVILY